MRFLAIARTAVLIVLSVVAIVGGFALLARRLLGMRFGMVRLLVAGLLGFAVAGPIARAVLGAVPTTEGAATPVWFLVLASASALVVAMVFLVVAEALVPTGSLPGPLEWRRALRGRLARARRYSQISRIAFRHGLGPYLRGRRRTELDTPAARDELARSVRQALDEGGVTFVKLGQILSTRPDLLPPEFTDELGRLQDQAAPAPWPQVEQVLRADLGGPVEEVFARFDREPLAAASIAQVHAARLRSGAEVVVKVQRPGIRLVVERDLDIVARLARTVEDRTRWGRSIGVRDLATGFADAVREELDFRIEAANMAAVAAAGHGRDGAVEVPVSHTPLCSERVLVMQRLEGTPLGAAESVIADRGLDRDALARALLGFMLRQVLLDGVFHADPHPGNVLVLADGRLGLLDFGSVGRLDTSVRAALQRLLLAMERADPLAASDALLEVLLRPDEIDQERLERSLGQFMAGHLGPGTTPGVRMFSELFGIVSEYGLSVPPEVAAVFRALATLEGRSPASRRASTSSPRRGRWPAATSPRSWRSRRRGRWSARSWPCCCRCCGGCRADRADRQRHRARPAQRARPAVRRRARPAPPHGHAAPDPAHHPGRHRRHHGRAAAGDRRRPQGDRDGQPVPAARLQPAGRVRHPRPAGAGADLPA